MVGFEIHVSESADFQNSELCYKDVSLTGQSEYVIDCRKPLKGAYIRLSVPKTTSLAVREMEVYSEYLIFNK